MSHLTLSRTSPSGRSPLDIPLELPALVAASE
jgi:hypothetical protein